MTPELWRAVEVLFEQVSELAPADRELLLADAEPHIRREVEKLLEADGASGLLDQAVREGEELLESIPRQRFGAYRATDLIGMGGMGTVYKGVRDDDAFSKEVAIKVLHQSMHSPFARHRFRQERQILAGLEHPNIARLIDGGETETGESYIVLEFVDGEPITKHAERAGLDRDGRLHLFLQVCAGVQYAHQNLIVHRDLKPGNILVTRDHTPKLLDFGIAKLLDAEGEQTVMGFQALTPRYASPEQVRGEPISAATDVYSLGIILYELLTGRRPYDITTTSPIEIERAVCLTEPAQPRISEDLDNIILMALRKEPGRRYGSVEQFIQDIQRALSFRPVIAREETLIYRSARFLRRNRWSVAAGFLLFASLSGGLILSQYHARRAERQAEQVRQLANRFLFDVDDAIRDIPGSTKAQELIVTTALEYLDALSRDTGGDLNLQTELATAYEKVGDVQGNPSRSNLGRRAEALNSYEKARVLREEVVRKIPADARAIQKVAENYLFASDIEFRLSQRDAAITHMRHAVELMEQARRTAPDDLEVRYGVANGHFRIGTFLFNEGDQNRARESFSRSLEAYSGVAKRQPNSKNHRAVAVTLDRLGRIYTEVADRAKAVETHRTALAIREELARLEPGSFSAQRGLAKNYETLADALGSPRAFDATDFAGAEKYYLAAVAIGERLSASDRANMQLASDRVILNRKLGDLYARRQPLKALPYFDRAIAEASSFLKTSSDNDKALELSQCSYGQALALQELKRPAEAWAAANQALAVQEGLLQRGYAPARDDLIETKLLIGDLHLAARRIADARKAYESAIFLAEEDATGPAQIGVAASRTRADCYSKMAALPGLRSAESCAWRKRIAQVWENLRRSEGPAAAYAETRLRELRTALSGCTSAN
jgi:serine/threonine protein kinase